MASVTFDKATRLYPGGTRPAVDKLDLEVGDGEFLVLVGPSGCGKSTSLRMLAGLEEVNEGNIFIGDRNVTDVPPKDRDIAMVFQNYALYPHMTVAENMGFALKIAGVGKEERAARVLEAAKLLDLEPYLNRKPKALSGGQRQRVAMGRAIVRQPQVFLMDEPLSNLDAKLRVQTRTQIASLQRRLGVTTVYVTHDQTEALTMGDRIAVLKDGVLQQVGTPRDLYERPNNVFVAGFIGSPAMNLFHADLVDGGVKFGTATVPVDRDAIADASEPGRHDRRPSRGHRRVAARRARASRSSSTSSRSSAPTATSTATRRSRASAPTSSRASTAACTRTRATPSTSPPRRSHVHVFDAESGLAPLKKPDRRLTSSTPSRCRSGLGPAGIVVPEYTLSLMSGTLSITSAMTDPALLDLPWHLPLEAGPSENIAALPKGISRHLVRFAHLSGHVVAIKETTAEMAKGEYEMLRTLQRMEIPCVEPVAVITNRTDVEGAELASRARHPAPPLLAPLPRAVLPDAAPRHRDPPRRRARGAARAAAHHRLLLGRRVAVEHPVPTRRGRVRRVPRRCRDRQALRGRLSNGQRENDLEIARVNIAGELLDLEAGGRVADELDPVRISTASSMRTATSGRSSRAASPSAWPTAGASTSASTA